MTQQALPRASKNFRAEPDPAVGIPIAQAVMATGVPDELPWTLPVPEVRECVGEIAWLEWDAAVAARDEQ